MDPSTLKLYTFPDYPSHTSLTARLSRSGNRVFAYNNKWIGNVYGLGNVYVYELDSNKEWKRYKNQSLTNAKISTTYSLVNRDGTVMIANNGSSVAAIRIPSDDPTKASTIFTISQMEYGNEAFAMPFLNDDETKLVIAGKKHVSVFSVDFDQRQYRQLSSMDEKYFESILGGLGAKENQKLFTFSKNLNYCITSYPFGTNRYFDLTVYKLNPSTHLYEGLSVIPNSAVHGINYISDDGKSVINSDFYWNLQSDGTWSNKQSLNGKVTNLTIPFSNNNIIRLLPDYYVSTWYIKGGKVAYEAIIYKKEGTSWVAHKKLTQVPPDGGLVFCGTNDNMTVFLFGTKADRMHILGNQPDQIRKKTITPTTQPPTFPTPIPTKAAPITTFEDFSKYYVKSDGEGAVFKEDENKCAIGCYGDDSCKGFAYDPGNKVCKPMNSLQETVPETFFRYRKKTERVPINKNIKVELKYNISNNKAVVGQDYKTISGLGIEYNQNAKVMYIVNQLSESKKITHQYIPFTIQPIGNKYNVIANNAVLGKLKIKNNNYVVVKTNTMTPTPMAPTTMAPTTMAPTTMAPTTMAPTTMAPTTMAPTTMAPTTMAKLIKNPTFTSNTSIIETEDWTNSGWEVKYSSTYNSAYKSYGVFGLSEGGWASSKAYESLNSGWIQIKYPMLVIAKKMEFRFPRWVMTGGRSNRHTWGPQTYTITASKNGTSWTNLSLDTKTVSTKDGIVKHVYETMNPSNESYMYFRFTGRNMETVVLSKWFIYSIKQ